MMTVKLSGIGKRFNTEWIFRNLDYEFSAGGKYAITGPNGSGKSTLLQLAGGYMLPNAGAIEYLLNGKSISPEASQHAMALAAPYMEVVEEMTLKEFFQFHFNMKPCIPGISHQDIAAAVSLTGAFHKQIRYYSSGMKQRVKLAQAIFSNVPLILLDEPLTNLDAEGVSMYQNLIETFLQDRTVIVSSNDEREFSFCKHRIDMREFK